MSKLTESRLKLHDWIIGYDYFISYSHKDGLNYPAKLKLALEENGYKVCLDQQDFLAGQKLSSLTKRRIQASRNLIVLARPRAITCSEWVPKEVSLFLEYQSDNSKGPITIDINRSIVDAIEAGNSKNTLASQLHSRDWLRIEENISTLDNDPSKSVVEEISRSHNGIRAEKKQLRIQNAAITALLLTTVSFGIAAWKSNKNSIIAEQNSTTAQAEGLAATALVEATTKDPRVGFAGSAFAKAAEAVTKRSTIGTRRSAARVLEDIPANIKFSPHNSAVLGDIAVTDRSVYVTEGSEKLNVYSLDDLTLVKTETPETLGIDFIGDVVATHNGVIVTGRLLGVWIDDNQKDHFEIPGWVNKMDFHMQSGKLIYSIHQDGVFWGTKETIRQSEIAKTCKPPNALPLLGYSLGEDNSIVFATQSASRTIDIHRVDLNTCNIEWSAQLEDTGFYDMIRAGEQILIRTTEQIMVLNSRLETVQLLHDPGITVWLPISITESNKRAKGFITTQGNGNFKLYTQTNDGRFSLTEESNTLLPGQVEDLAQRNGTNEILISARAGHFVSSDLPGVLAKVPLTLRTYNGIHSIHFQQYEPAVSLHYFKNTVTHSTQNGQSIFAGLSDGSIHRISAIGEIVEISGNDLTHNRPSYSLRAMTASQTNIFVARKISASESALLKIEGNSETQITTVTPHIQSMASTNDGVFYRTNETFYFFDLKTGENTKFDIDDFNGNQGHKTMVTSPNGEWIVFGLFNGFDIRRTSAVTQEDLCSVTPHEDAAGVVAAFSTDSKHLVLGSWEGQLSLWKQEASCWTKIHDFDAERGTMIPTVAFINDNKTLVGSLAQSQSRLQLWDVATGNDLGTNYPTSASTIIPSGDNSFLLLRDRDAGVIDTSTDDLIERLCAVARDVISAGLTGHGGQHTCIRKTD